MIAFQFNHNGQTFEAEFVRGQIEYDRGTVAAYLGLDPRQLPDRVSAAQAPVVIPPEKLNQFREWHSAAQETVFTLIKADNEYD
ncbi:MAG: hypothetical protein ICV83_16595 [Cytophagales bacterium]|nr:hypothetical protein [Cytophagales bacterium]